MYIFIIDERAKQLSTKHEAIPCIQDEPAVPSLTRDIICTYLNCFRLRRHCWRVCAPVFKGKWQQNFLSSHLKETPKQYIEVC